MYDSLEAALRAALRFRLGPVIAVLDLAAEGIV